MKTKITILAVDISQITKKESVKTVEGWLSSPRVKPHFIVTPNPEMLVLAQKDKEFYEILNSADLAIPDGIGLVWASQNKLTERVSGTDLMLDLCELASQKGYTIGLLGAGEGVAKKTAEALKKKFPGIKIKFAVSETSELSAGFARPPLANARGGLIKGVDLLFIAFGAHKQEKWINTHLTANSHQLKAKVYMGVGGAFDLISGKIKRSPKMMRDMGLEWLWRLVQEPKRIKRIWTATIVFPLLVLKYKVWYPKNP